MSGRHAARATGHERPARFPRRARLLFLLARGSIAMTALQFQKHIRPRRAKRPRFCFEFPCPLIRGRRECRAPMRRGKKCARSSHGHTGITRHSPRNGFNGFLRALPGDRALLPPSPAGPTASLTPASRCQDHTTWPSASNIARLARRCVPHPAPTSVTFAKRPSEWNGTANHIARFRFRKNRNIFANGAGQTFG
jgi:hypothetical protein